MLGAYQVGVYEALCEAGFEPDWMIGASITLPADVAATPEARELRPIVALPACPWFACQHRRSRARTTPRTLISSGGGIKQRWQAGYDDTRSVLAQAPGSGESLEGLILHGARPGKMMFED